MLNNTTSKQRRDTFRLRESADEANHTGTALLRLAMTNVRKRLCIAFLQRRGLGIEMYQKDAYLRRNDTRASSEAGVLTVGRGHHVREGGTLLMEMLAAFAIISVTLVIVADVFMTSNRASAIALRQVEVSDAIAFALADITREAKVSEGYGVSAGKFGMTRVAGLNGQTADPVEYSLTSGSLQKKVTGGPVDLTPPDKIIISNFIVTVNTLGGVTRALITFSARHEDGPNDPPVYIQTTLTERMF